jgi:uncharacterized FAD-dependent dehydrogenase
MQQKISLRLLPSEANDDRIIKQYLSSAAAVAEASISGYQILKQSIDARGKQAYINLTLLVFIDEPFIERNIDGLKLKDVHHAQRSVVIVGAGPAGLFAALQLIELNIKPIIIERGKDVRARRRDLAALNKEGIVNPESNYCFGEGGAGTYSDGKLYTRSNKRGDIDTILNTFVQYGAEEKILYQSHPHIGTNKLPQIITSMREAIIQAGGEIHFETKLTDIAISADKIDHIIVNENESLKADAYILATGHSARDIFELFHQKKILIEAKPFALGVRIEHPQGLIDSIQYHCPIRDSHLPPAPYSLVEQVNGRGVFSFCMCPGGIIAPAATSPGELVVNGWSPSKRNNPYANSGMVVQVELKDALNYFKLKKDDSPLVLMNFQKAIEEKAFIVGGGKFVAPAQRMVDFCNNKVSSTLPENSYLPGTNSVALSDVLPPFIHQTLQKGFLAFGKKMRGYFTNDAIVVATESRTSSPIRIPRDAEKLNHPQISNLYPCGEGAGYAGGIVSAAMDGQKIARLIHANFY